MPDIDHFQATKTLLTQAAESQMLPAAQICLMQYGEVILSESFGKIDQQDQIIPASNLTLFDLSAITKVFTATAWMRLVDREAIHLDDPLCALCPEFSGIRPILPTGSEKSIGTYPEHANPHYQTVDASKITFRQLLRHSAGLPSNMELFLLENPQQAREAVMRTPFVYEPDSDVVDSDIGYLLLGWAIENLCDTNLSTVIEDLILNPLHLLETGFRPLESSSSAPLPQPVEGIAPTKDLLWRNKWLRGEVNDRNSAFFNGIAGHAGLFSTASDLAAFGQAFLGGSDLLKADSLFAMTHSQAISRDGRLQYGLGFQLWSDDQAAACTAFSSEVFGLTGASECGLLVDPQRELVVAFLSNQGLNPHKLVMSTPFTSQLIHAILNDLQ
jgi:CubicO group peptidase (beta-lactamase class C family)